MTAISKKIKGPPISLPVMVAGASSLLGQRVVDFYLSRNIPVVGIDKSPSNIKDPLLNIIQLDLSKEAIPSELFRGVETLVYVVWDEFSAGVAEKKGADSARVKAIKHTLSSYENSSEVENRRFILINAQGYPHANHQEEGYLIEHHLINSLIETKTIVRSSPLCFPEIDDLPIQLHKGLESLTQVPLAIPLLKSFNIENQSIDAFMSQFSNIALQAQGEALAIHELQADTSLDMNAAVKSYCLRRKIKKPIFSGFLAELYLRYLSRFSKYKKLNVIFMQQQAHH